MKKSIIYLCVTVIAMFATFYASAETRQGTGNYVMHNDIKYEIIDAEEMTVGVAVQDPDCPTYIAIPETIAIENNDESTSVYTVVQINAEAFKGNRDLFKVKFAKTITAIGNSAFEDCPILNFEELPENLLSIGERAFYGCNAIKRIKLPESTTTLGKECFSKMESLQRAILFSNVTELPFGAFKEDTQLEDVYLPENLIKIESEAFAWDTLIEEIKLPSTLEEIGDHAFIGGAPDRTGLKRVVLPKSIKKIGLAFRHTGLLSVDLGNLEEVPECAFEACYELREVIFSPNLKSIGAGAFSACGANAGRTMNDLILPEEVENISENAFDGSNVLSLTIGDGIKTLPKHSCGTPKILTIGKNVKSIDPEAFDPTQIMILKLGATVPPTVKGGFPLTAEQQRKITVIVPNEDAKILYKEHEYWKEFNVVVLESTAVSVILDGSADIATAIYNTSKVMPAEVTRLKVSGHISDKDFQIMKENMLSLLYLDMADADNTVLPAGVFKNKLSLENVILPKDLIRIENEAFAGCSSMNISELPDGIEYIGSGAFADCERITISRLPEALKYLGDWAFRLCASIRTVSFGPELETMEAAFHWCEGIEFVDMSRATKLRDIPGQAFVANYNLRHLILPEGIESLGGEFIGETLIKTLNIPGTVNRVEESAFVATNLRVISLGEGIKELPDNTLAYNKKLLTVNLPSTLESLSESTFVGSKKISAISCMAKDAPEASVASFEDINTRTCVLSVPVQSFFSYLSAIGWGMFSNIQNTIEIDIPDDVELTTVPEEDYQDLVEEEESEQRAIESAEAELENKEPNSVKALKASMLKQRATESDNLLNGALFCKLKNGTVLASEENEDSKGQRIFIRTSDDKPITSVMIDGVEKVHELTDNSLVLPSGAVGKLVINGGSKTTGVNNIKDVIDGKASNVYDLTGRCVIVNATADQLNSLDKGVYIFKGKKICIR